MIASSAERVSSQTDEQVNQQINRLTEANIAHFARHPEEIDRRLAELDEEWDIERTLQANAASISLVGATFGLLFGRKWIILPAVVSGFLLQHALQGWCPPLPLFRRMGVRTVREIDQERYALKALRGDFRDIDPNSDPNRAMDAAAR
jgi:hypothetical protein